MSVLIRWFPSCYESFFLIKPLCLCRCQFTYTLIAMRIILSSRSTSHHLQEEQPNLARCQIINLFIFVESYLVMLISRNLLSKYAPPLTFFSLKMWHFFQQKSFIHFALFYFLCCHNAKIQPKNTLILQTRILTDPFKF